MTYPVGCIMTGKTKVQGQCDYAACNYPFCEASENAPRPLTANERAVANNKLRLGHEK